MAFTTAELCHFLGREQLRALFSWPAGGGGSLLYSYGQDRESGDFSVGHLKKVIRSIPKVPGIEKVHLLAHNLNVISEFDCQIKVKREVSSNIMFINKQGIS